MRLWISSFLILLVLAELFQWLKSLSIPLPVLIVGGVLLAVASNLHQLRLGDQPQNLRPEPPSSEPLDAIDVASYEVVDSSADSSS